MTVRVAVIAEDVHFAEFLVPAIESIARSGGVEVLITVAEHVRGCRPHKLAEILDRVSPVADVVVVGADASAPGFPERARTHRQKASGLRLITQPYSNVSLAIAAPSVEGWLLADHAALVDGLERETGGSFRSPSRWPMPRTEAEAKSMLGNLIANGLDAILTRGGFEYADAIVRRSNLLESSNASLADWAREFKRRLAILAEAG